MSGDTSSFYNQELVYGHYYHLRNSYAPEGPVQVELFAAVAEYTRGQLCNYVCMQGSPVENQTRAHWNLIGRSVIAPASIVIA